MAEADRPTRRRDPAGARRVRGAASAAHPVHGRRRHEGVHDLDDHAQDREPDGEAGVRHVRPHLRHEHRRMRRRLRLAREGHGRALGADELGRVPRRPDLAGAAEAVDLPLPAHRAQGAVAGDRRLLQGHRPLDPRD